MRCSPSGDRMTSPRQRGADQSETTTVAALHGSLGDPDLVIVDTRPPRAFNGWRLGDDPRGGHIPGAVAFPIEWLGTVDPGEIDRILGGKGVVRGRRAVVYGRDPADATRLAPVLHERGLTDVRPLAGGFAAWAAHVDLPVARLPRFPDLVHPDWLADVLAGRRPEAAPAGRSLVFQVNFGVFEEYAEGHIPGAHFLDTERLEDPSDLNVREPRALERALCALGITHDTTVVLYGRDSSTDANGDRSVRRAGQIAAMRALMILRYAGVEDVRLLDGGYDGWVRAGHPVELTVRRPDPVESFGTRVPARPDVIVGTDDVRSILADQDGAVLVSVRSWREHIGDASGYDYIKPAGRISGDVWGNGGSDAYHMEHYRNPDATMRAYPEIAAIWAEAGITPDKASGVLLRDRLACQRGLVLGLSAGLAPSLGV